MFDTPSAAAQREDVVQDDCGNADESAEIVETGGLDHQLRKIPLSKLAEQLTIGADSVAAGHAQEQATHDEHPCQRNNERRDADVRHPVPLELSLIHISEP